MICQKCGSYYRQSPYNNTNQCDDCHSHDPSLYVDYFYPDTDDIQEVKEEIYRRQRDGKGKTRPVFYD